MNISIRNLDKRYGEKQIFSGFSTDFSSGKTTCVMGPSGCGKTTLIRILLEIETVDGGTVSGVPEKKAAVFQEDRLLMYMSPEDNVLLAAASGIGRSTVRSLLCRLGLENGLTLRAESLSGGMRRRTALARALLSDYELLVLDEPFKGLDRETREKTAEIIKKMSAGKTLICVTHDPEEVTLLGGNILRIS